MATVCALAVMAAAGYYVFDRAVVGGEYVTVPNVVNMPATDAYRTLVKAGLDVGEQRERPNDSVPENCVIAQSPAPGHVVRAGRSVRTTISVGPESEPAPNLVGMTLKEAEAEIARLGRFQVGPPFARIPHPATNDLILAQDPPAGKLTERDCHIQLLLSGGKSGGSFLMQDLVNMPLQDVLRTLTRLGLTPVPIIVERPDAPFDIVLEQDPPAGTLVRQGSRVRFKVRTSAYLEGAWREVTITYTVPYSWHEREVRIEAVCKDGTPYTLYPQAHHLENGRPPKLGAGQRITQKLEFEDQVTVIVYLDGQKAQTYYFEGDADPVITTYEIDSEGEESA